MSRALRTVPDPDRAADGNAAAAGARGQLPGHLRPLSDPPVGAPLDDLSRARIRRLLAGGREVGASGRTAAVLAGMAGVMTHPERDIENP
jgi:hypothetical protein